MPAAFALHATSALQWRHDKQQVEETAAAEGEVEVGEEEKAKTEITKSILRQSLLSGLTAISGWHNCNQAKLPQVKRTSYMVCRWPQPSASTPTTPSPPSARGCALLHVGYLVYYRIPWLPSRLSASQVGATSRKCVCERVYTVCVCVYSVCVQCVCIECVCACVCALHAARKNFKGLEAENTLVYQFPVTPSCLLLLPPSLSLPLPCLCLSAWHLPFPSYAIYSIHKPTLACYSGQRIDVY